ncbi:MAG: ABC transporter permease subunit [Chloroflexi bacterium]|nr:ABC transporter permease subunit [Chloroflexota bacterium]
MKALWIAQKELRSYFTSPLAYVITAAFLVITGYLFALTLVFSQEASLRIVLSNMSTILLLLSPALTMRLLAEEQRHGTVELLLTSPVRDYEVVLGKYLGAVALFACMLLLTGLYVVVLVQWGQPDLLATASGYLGVLLLGATYLALGLLTSSLTQNQVVAAVLAFALTLILYLIGAAADIAQRPVSDVFRYLAIGEHYFDFARGVVDTRHIVYYLSVIVGALFITVRSLETRRWGS